MKTLMLLGLVVAGPIHKDPDIFTAGQPSAPVCIEFCQ